MPKKVHCAHILVKTEKEAQAVMERLNGGEKFSHIAIQVSICASGKRGGDLGTFGRGKMVKDFEQAAFKLQKGKISPIVKTQLFPISIIQWGLAHRACMTVLCHWVIWPR